MNKLEFYKSFKDEVEKLEIWDYNEFDNNLKNYILNKEFDLEKFETEGDLKKYLEKWIHLFKEKILWEILGEELWLNYSEQLAEEFHKKYLEIIKSWNFKNFYEDTISKF